VLLALLTIFLTYGTYQYKRFILAPPDSDWTEVNIEDLLAERWYQTPDDRRLTEDLERITDSSAMKLASGLYYREYKHRYSPGVKQTQYVHVGPTQYPVIYSMVTEACTALGSMEGEPIQVPSVYIGWTGKRSFEVTNFTP